MKKYLFGAREKKTGNFISVFGMTDDSNGYPKFLIREDNQWKWKSAKHFMPL